MTLYRGPTVHFFFLNSVGNTAKIGVKDLKKGKFTFHIKECYLHNIRGGFWMGSWGNIKKRRTLSIVSFLQGFWIWHQNWNQNNLKFWPPIGKEKFQGKSLSTYHHILVLEPDSKEGLGSCPKEKCWKKIAGHSRLIPIRPTSQSNISSRDIVFCSLEAEFCYS